MSRVAITLDEQALAELGRRAQAAREPVARTAARMVRDGLLSSQAQNAEGPPPAAARQPAEASGAGSPGGIEPPGERERWRRELWAAARALAERYPPLFSKLVADGHTVPRAHRGPGSAQRMALRTGHGPEPRPMR